MVHVVRSTSDPRILFPTLPDQLQHIIHTWQDIIHEHDRIEHLVFVIPQFVQRDHGGVTDFGEILYPMIELTSRTHTGPNDNSQADSSGESIEYLQEGFRLITRSILVYRHEDILVSENSSDAEERGKDIGNDVERIVKVDSEEVFVLLGRKREVASDILPSTSSTIRV